jgi:Putative Zn-dependent protease, contains TPR repeats
VIEAARKELKIGQLSSATVNKLQQLVAANPNDSEAHMTLGLVLDRMGLPDPAQEQFFLAVKYGANNQDAVVALCKGEISAGRTDVAMGILNAGLKRFPQNAEMLYMVGDFLFDHDRYAEAAQVLDQAFRLDQNVKGLPTALGRIYLRGNPARAAALAAMDLAKDPAYEPAIRLRGIAYKDSGKYEKAVADLQPAFDRAKDVVPISDALADCYTWLGRYKEALRPSIYMVAFSAPYDIENVPAVDKLARVMSRVPKSYIEEVIATESPEIDRKAHKAEFHYNLGRALDQVGMYQAAMNEYKQAVKMRPEYVRAYYRLGRDQEMFEKNYPEALESYAKAHNLRSWDGEIDLAYNRLSERLANRNKDLSWQIKDWLSKIFN